MDLIYLYVVPKKANSKSSDNCVEENGIGDLCVRMEVKKVYRESEQNVQIEDKDESDKYEHIIYLPGNEDFVNFLRKNQEQEGINKVKAWETFCKLIDAVNNYKTDFEEMKKEYEPYHRD